jgi:hypothetical protein
MGEERRGMYRPRRFLPSVWPRPPLICSTIWPGLRANENFRGFVFDLQSSAAYTEYIKGGASNSLEKNTNEQDT